MIGGAKCWGEGEGVENLGPEEIVGSLFPAAPSDLSWLLSMPF